MAVQVDGSAISGQGTPGSTSQLFQNNGNNFTLDLGSGPNGQSNRALVVALIFIGAAGGTSTSPSVTWDGVSMSALSGGSVSNGGDIFLFGLRNPNLGLKNISCSWTGANQACVAMLSVVGVDTSSDAAAFKNLTSATGTSSPNSISITAPSGDVSFAGHVVNANYTTSGGGTDIGFNDNGNLSSAAANYNDASSNPTLTYAFTSGSTWATVGVDIRALGGGGGGGGAAAAARYYYETYCRGR